MTILNMVRIENLKMGILDSGFNLTLRPMQYPQFFDLYKDGIKNTWTVEEIDFTSDLSDLRNKIKPSERHLINRLVAFFATGDTIVSNNLVINLYKHINSPEARMYLSRQLFEEAQHVEFYLLLLDSYVKDENERKQAFEAIKNINSIQKKASFCFKWIDSIKSLDTLSTFEEKQTFLLNLICFACCIEGLFFFAAFAYVYFLRSKGLLQGLASGTNWVFRDESMHIKFALEVINTIRDEEPELFTSELNEKIVEMMIEAVDCEYQFAKDVLSLGVGGMSEKNMLQYLQFIADQRFQMLKMPKLYNIKNPFGFMELQDMQELTNFFERRVSAYQTGISGEVRFDEEF